MSCLDHLQVLKNPIRAIKVYNLKQKAFAETHKNYPHTVPHNNEADAFRHFYWNYTMTQELGREATQEITTGHEIHDRENMTTEERMQDTRERNMDLWNNFIGQDAASDLNLQNKTHEEIFSAGVQNNFILTSPTDNPDYKALAKNYATWKNKNTDNVKQSDNSIKGGRCD